MRTHPILIAFACWVVLFVPLGAWAVHTPANMNVQGRLTYPDGQPVASITQTFSFKIFDAETGGTEIWPAGPGEDHTVATDLEGIWAATVGATLPLSGDVFADTSRWLEITIDNGYDPPVTLSRVKLNSTPFVWQASRSEYADSSTTIADDAITTGKIAPGAVEGSDLNQNGADAGQVMTWNGSQWGADDAIPAGVIVMWSGAATTIPPGWTLCDGNNGTPDLRNRFVMGATNAGGTGGSTTASWGGHTHVVNPAQFVSQTNSSTYCSVWEVGGQCVAANGHSHAIDVPPTTSTSDGANTVSIIPPYYNLAYIMKL